MTTTLANQLPRINLANGGSMPDDNTAVYRKKVLTDDVIWSQAAEASDAPNIVFVLEQHGIPKEVANAICGGVDDILW